MRSETRERRSRQAAAAERMTKAQRVHQKLNSGAPKYELRTLQETLQFAAAFYRQMREAMTIGDVKTEFGLHIAYLTPDFSYLFTRKYEPGGEKQIYDELSQGCFLMVGLIFGMRDPDDPKGRWLVGNKKFLDTPLIRTAMEQRMDGEDIGIS
jgi:hypothetical protein